MSEAEVPRVPLWQSSILADHTPALHGFTGREGGVSEGAFASLNLGSRVNDTREAVLSNRARALESLGRPNAMFVALKQVHSPTVVQVTAQASPHIEADAMWTTDPNCVLAVLGADCLPIVLADAKGRAVAAAHAGWRGTHARIAARLVERLAAVGIPATDLYVAMGPAIGPCCFEIGDDVANQLAQAYPAAPPGAVQFFGTTPHADLWALNLCALREAGVPEDHIDVVRRCTRCSSGLFSYRGAGGVTGRQAGLVALREPPRVS